MLDIFTEGPKRLASCTNCIHLGNAITAMREYGILYSELAILLCTHSGTCSCCIHSCHFFPEGPTLRGGSPKG